MSATTANSQIKTNEGVIINLMGFQPAEKLIALVIPNGNGGELQFKIETPGNSDRAAALKAAFEDSRPMLEELVPLLAKRPVSFVPRGSSVGHDCA